MGFFVVKTTLNQRFLSILFVGFLAANRFDVLGVSQNNITGWLQNIVDGNPILSGGLHTHIPAVVFSQPYCTPPQIPGEGGESLTFIGGYPLTIGCGNARNQKRFVDIHSATGRIDDFKHNTSPQKQYLRKTGRDWTLAERLK